MKETLLPAADASGMTVDSEPCFPGMETRRSDALASARNRLAGPPMGPGPSSREAALLLAHTLDLSEAQLLAHLDEPMSAPELKHFRELLERRLAGEPVAYLVGRREFWGRPFLVDAHVLIPRPETEHVVEEALRLDLSSDAQVLDLGTGSGCLAVTLALERPGWRVFATDISLAALGVARRNAARLGSGELVRFAASDLTAALRGRRFDLIVCNPPYIDPLGAPALPREVAAFEPPGALYAEDGGFAVLRRVLGSAEMHPGAALVVELGAGQAERATTEAAAAGWRPLRVVPDLRGIDRVLVARKV